MKCENCGAEYRGSITFVSHSMVFTEEQLHEAIGLLDRFGSEGGPDTSIYERVKALFDRTKKLNAHVLIDVGFG